MMSSRLEEALSQPSFDSLTVVLTTTSRRDARTVLDDATKQLFDKRQVGWQTVPVHKSVPHSFDLIPPPDHGISTKQGFELQYILREHRLVREAHALFETNQTDIPEGVQVSVSDEDIARGNLFQLHSNLDELTDEEIKPMWVHHVLKTSDLWREVTGKGIRVGHPDSGYIRHVELDDERVLHSLGRNFYFEGSHRDASNPIDRGGNHGLGTASVLMSGEGKFSDDFYVVGSAPEATIVPLRITRGGPPLLFTRSGPRMIRDAIYYAVSRGCDVISMSLGGLGAPSLRQAIQHAVNNNVLVLAAAGNVVRIVVWPARYPEVIAVAGCTADGEKWFNSSRGRTVDVTAPAHNVWRAYYEDGDPEDQPAVAPSSGTSYAVALVAGVACLWLEKHGRDFLLNKYKDIPLQYVFRHLLQKTAASPPPDHQGLFGHGIVDAQALLAAKLLDAEQIPLPTQSRSLSDVNAIIEVFDEQPPEVIRGALAHTLDTRATNLGNVMKGVEDELLFHLLTMPSLRQTLIVADGEILSSRGVAKNIQSTLATSDAVSDQLRKKLNMEQINMTSLEAPEPVIMGNPSEEGTVYALLVGIDKYNNPAHNLQGCVNDINAFEQFLIERFDHEKSQLNILKLLDHHATRKGVIHAWRTHLQQATEADTVIFYYSGHGSQAPSPEKFWPFEPDKLDEGLVCWDSRTTDWDLADKELAQLIHEVAQNNPHIVVILDCCHSGSGTRDVEGPSGVRRLPTDRRQRTIEQFIVRPDQVMGQGDEATDNWISLPTGRHIVLSACQPHEEAREVNFAGQRRGVFSYYLLETLQRTGRMLSYHELFKRTNALVRARVARQAPMIEATIMTDLNQPFLGGSINQGQPWFTLSHVDNRGWTIDGGIVHGIGRVNEEETTWLAIFPFETAISQLYQRELAVGQAKVQMVTSAHSGVQVIPHEGQVLAQSEVYKAVMTSAPLPLLEVRLDGEPSEVAKVRNAIENAMADGVPSPYVRESGSASLAIIADRDKFRIQRPEESYRLVIDTLNRDEAAARLVVQRLEHIARWQNLIELDNKNSQLPVDAVKLEVISLDDPQSTERNAGLHLTYQRDEHGNWHKPRVLIRLTNQTNQVLRFSLLFMAETYGIQTYRDNELLPPNNPPAEFRVSTQVLDQYWREGITKFKDTVKLIVSTEEINAGFADQPDLPTTFIQERGVTRGTAAQNTLQRVLKRLNLRHIGDDDETKPIADWVTSQVSVTTTRPKEDVDVHRDIEQRLSDLVTIAPHSALKARVRLNGLTPPSRSIGLHPLPAPLRDQPAVSYPIELTGESGTRGGDAGTTVLELFDIEDVTAVSPENPLEVQLNLKLDDGELLLPIAHDDKFYLPVGYVEAATEHAITVRIEQLPAATLDGSRSPLHSVRLLFQKIVGQPLGFEYHYPQLAAVTVSADGQLRYDTNAGSISQQVAAADKILLWIHGLFDKSENIIGKAVNVASQVHHGYDLILAYDYENLQTTIEETGTQLSQKLQAVGLTSGHGKTFDIIAHSLGGLVARWMIEQAGGKTFVSHLITVASPHAGSPWSTIQDVALVGLTAVLNSMTTVSWPLRAISLLVQAVEKGDVTLDEMKPNSDFMQRLAMSPDPHVPYTLVVGDTALIRREWAGAEEQADGLLKEMLRRLTSRTIKHDLATIVAFFGEPNDIAVSVKSAGAVPVGREPRPIVLPAVGLDHVSFFNTELGLQTIVQNRRH